VFVTVVVLVAAGTELSESVGVVLVASTFDTRRDARREDEDGVVDLPDDFRRWRGVGNADRRVELVLLLKLPLAALTLMSRSRRGAS